MSFSILERSLSLGWLGSHTLLSQRKRVSKRTGECFLIQQVQERLGADPEGYLEGPWNLDPAPLQPLQGAVNEKQQ